METLEFTDFDISAEMIDKLKKIGIESFYKVQAETFNYIKSGCDVVTLAKTGSGKTLAYSIPIAEQLKSDKSNLARGRAPRVLVLGPTRELVNQISSVFSSICSNEISITSVYGGVPYQTQTRALNNGTDVVIGTPGRIIDLLESQKLNVNEVKYVILDEVDRMLDMGFSADVEKILSDLYNDSGKQKPQTLLFSATLPSWVSEISKRYVSQDAKRISLVGKMESRTSDTVEHLAILCPFQVRANAISDVIRVYSRGEQSRCIVFCERKKDAEDLSSHPVISSDCLVFHGDISQERREAVLQKFRDGKCKTLLTTNVAARGLDIPDVELVIQCAPPASAEDYIHRSGRTGRAGRSGTSICFYTMREKMQLSYVERGAGIHFRRISAPTANDIADIWASELSSSFLEIPKATWSTFLPAARSIISSLSPEDEKKSSSWLNIDEVGEENETLSENEGEKRKKSKNKVKKAITLENGETSRETTPCERALCCALAKIAGKMQGTVSRSILTAHDGRTAYKLDLPSTMNARSKSLLYSLLSSSLPRDVTESISNLSFIKDRTGFVFDIPDDKNEVITERWENHDGLVLEKLAELPELEPEPHRQNEGFGFGSRGRGTWGGQRSRGRGFGNGLRRFGGPSSRGGGFRGGSRGFGEKRPSSGFIRGGPSAKVMKFA